MKQIVAKTSKRSSFIPDDDSVRYKLNTQYINNTKLIKTPRKQQETKSEEDNIRYKFPPSSKLKTIEKPKPKPTIKVNFWSKKPNVSRLHKNDVKESSNRRHTISGIMSDNKSKSAVKVRKRVSFLPTPVFSDNHIPMVTVPDDLTIQLNEEEANDLGADLNEKNVQEAPNNTRSDTNKRQSKSLNIQSNTKSTRRKPSFDSVDSRVGNEYELEFFSKYVVQKLRRMETNQRIYSENLINTVLMLGQLGKLNVKSKIAEN
ncbi:uncharacterized protein LOC121731060 [Aricia agestis]|uniref:uncharacterized protein LOC121731060 n=1 Tax=Aricia agestis TaxID=91739 RepID=UPI001C202B1A|nr:uncharacterized protein LOC121731060 [Aricia agestis]